MRTQVRRQLPAQIHAVGMAMSILSPNFSHWLLNCPCIEYPVVVRRVDI
jgi:hypothetical protein